MRRTLAVLTLLVALPVLAATPLSVATPLEGAQHLSRYFAALREAAAGKKVVRALHYGDSTIAADGIARTVRARLVARFGDAGPGFVSAGMTPQFNQRSDVDSLRRGDWATRSILHGGAEGRYGLGGIVGIARTGASAVIKAPDGYSSK